MDSRRFVPKFVLPATSIVGKAPSTDAQVWRALLIKVATGRAVWCWLFRHAGSRMRSQIDLVADIPLRLSLVLRADDRVAVLVFER